MTTNERHQIVIEQTEMNTRERNRIVSCETIKQINVSTMAKQRVLGDKDGIALADS